LLYGRTGIKAHPLEFPIKTDTNLFRTNIYVYNIREGVLGFMFGRVIRSRGEQTTPILTKHFERVILGPRILVSILRYSPDGNVPNENRTIDYDAIARISSWKLERNVNSKYTTTDVIRLNNPFRVPFVFRRIEIGLYVKITVILNTHDATYIYIYTVPLTSSMFYRKLSFVVFSSLNSFSETKALSYRYCIIK